MLELSGTAVQDRVFVVIGTVLEWALDFALGRLLSHFALELQLLSQGFCGNWRVERYNIKTRNNKKNLKREIFHPRICFASDTWQKAKETKSVIKIKFSPASAESALLMVIWFKYSFLSEKKTLTGEGKKERILACQFGGVWISSNGREAGDWFVKDDYFVYFFFVSSSIIKFCGGALRGMWKTQLVFCLF